MATITYDVLEKYLATGDADAVCGHSCHPSCCPLANALKKQGGRWQIGSREATNKDTGQQHPLDAILRCFIGSVDAFNGGRVTFAQAREILTESLRIWKPSKEASDVY